MRKSIAVFFAVSAAATGAFAESYAEHNTPFVSTASRAQVAAQVGERVPAEANPASNRYNPLADFRSHRTRAQVRAEYLAERDFVSRITAEDSGSSYLAARRSEAQKVAGSPTRAQ